MDGRQRRLVRGDGGARLWSPSASTLILVMARSGGHDLVWRALTTNGVSLAHRRRADSACAGTTRARRVGTGAGRGGVVSRQRQRLVEAVPTLGEAAQEDDTGGVREVVPAGLHFDRGRRMGG